MLGKTNGFIISFIMLLYTCGSCISYFVIIGPFARSSSPAGDLFLDVFQFLLPNVPLLQSRAVVVGGICLLFVFPLCMMKSARSPPP